MHDAYAYCIFTIKLILYTSMNRITRSRFFNSFVRKMSTDLSIEFNSVLSGNTIHHLKTMIRVTQKEVANERRGQAIQKNGSGINNESTHICECIVALFENRYKKGGHSTENHSHLRFVSDDCSHRFWISSEIIG